MREARGTLSLSTQSLCFTLTPGLGALIMATATGFTEDTRLLHFAIKLFQRNLKRSPGTHNDLAHIRLPARSTAICVTVVLSWLVAILAIDGTIFSGLEGDSGFIPTTCAGGSVHGACFALAEPTTLSTTGTSLIATGLFAGGAAFGATAG